MPIRILIADDHAVFRSGLKVLLEKEPDLEVVAETGTGDETVKVINEIEVDVVTLDISMPGSTAQKTVKELLARKPGLAIVVLTMHDDEYYLQELLKAGVQAFVLKKSKGVGLFEAIRSAHRGEQYIDPSLAGRLIIQYVGKTNSPAKPDTVDILTPRETEICEMLAYGHTNVEISKKLHISERTVETHRMNIMSKLEIKSRAELVRFAIDNGLLKLF